MMKRNPFIILLWGMALIWLLPISAYSTNEKTDQFEQGNSHCSMKITAIANGVYCGKTTGAIDVTITGGTAPYVIEWDNRQHSIWNKRTVSITQYAIPNLRKGTYDIKVRDAKGCRATVQVTLDVNQSDLTYTVMVNDPCMTKGMLTFNVSGSAPPYWVILDGPTAGATLVENNEFTIEDLQAGKYTITIDKDGCGHTQEATITTSAATLSANAILVDNNKCDAFGDIQLDLVGGTPKYSILWAGPTSGSTRSSGSKLIQNLAPGKYKFIIRDANGCSTREKVTIEKSKENVKFSLLAYDAVCHKKGKIGVSIITGTPSFTITWTKGSRKESARSAGNHYIFEVDEIGIYEVEVTDANGCKAKETVEVKERENNLLYGLVLDSGAFEGDGSIEIDFQQGKSPYSIYISGPDTQRTITYEATVIRNLPSGYYYVSVTDANGCQKGISVKVPELKENDENGMRLADVINSQNLNSGIDKNLETAPSSTLLETTDNVPLKLIAENEVVDAVFKVYQNYPNPFKKSTIIAFSLPKSMEATITIHNNEGKLVRIFTKQFENGINQFELRPTELGLIKGVYYYTISTKDFSETNRMLFME